MNERVVHVAQAVYAEPHRMRDFTQFPPPAEPIAHRRPIAAAGSKLVVVDDREQPNRRGGRSECPILRRMMAIKDQLDDMA